LPIDKLYELRLLFLMHNYVHHKDSLPDVFLQYFVTNSAIHKFHTRDKMDFHLYHWLIDWLIDYTPLIRLLVKNVWNIKGLYYGTNSLQA